MKTALQKRYHAWKYLGYSRDELCPYDKEVAAGNLKILFAALWIALLVTAIEIGSILLFLYSGSGESVSLKNTLFFLIATLPFLAAEIVLCIRVRHRSQRIGLSRWLTTIFISYWILTTIIISTVINRNDYAVVVCGTFLAIQVVFDAYPAENLLFVSCAYTLFITISFLNQPLDIFLYNILDSIPFVVVGNCLSWVKSRSRWAALINTDAKVQLEKQKLENKLIQARISIMLSQIQPHFLYNALGVIYNLCDKDPEAAKTATANFSDYLRLNLDSLKMEAPIAFETELKHVKIYLSLEKMRFEEDLQIVYDIQATDFLIPALTVQPLVENAVKYGVGKAPHGGTVSISTAELADCFQITISDNGVGFDPYEQQEDGRTHIGIDNVKARLHDMVGAALTVRSEQGVGTTATITVPKEGVAI